MNLVTNNLTIRYGRRTAVDQVNLTAAPGTILAILGANGSGKSTLLRALAGAQAHDGTLLWDGMAGRTDGIGYMPQDTGMRASLTAFEVVLLGRLRSLTFRVDQRDLVAAEAAMAELGLHDLSTRHIGKLSGGQRQLVFIAQVLAADPRVLLLDEPTSALDIAHQLQVLDLLRTITQRRGLTTIAVLHDLNAAARFANRIALMQGGRLIAQGTPHEVLTVPLCHLAYGVEVSILPGPDCHPVLVPLRVARR